MINAILIREAVPEDVSAILALYQAAGINDAASFTISEAQEHLTVFQEYPSFRVFVALVDGIIAGTYELLIMDNLAKRGRRSGIVEDVAVHPDQQGNGIGRAMMQHALGLCREAGCYKLMLSSNQKRAAAHRFYETLGFKRHGFSFQVDL